jgi:hypothetical protein
LMNQLRTLKTDIAVEFNQKLIEALMPASSLAANNASNAPDDDELSLVGQDEMEGMVLVKSLGGRAAGKFQEQLSHLDKRLEELANKSSLSLEPGSLGPVNICQVFNDALLDHFEQPSKKVLFDFYDREILSQLGDLYDSLNQQLIDAGILPQIKASMGSPVQHQHRRPPESQHVPESQETGDPGSAQAHDVAHASMASSPGPASGPAPGPSPEPSSGHPSGTNNRNIMMAAPGTSSPQYSPAQDTGQGENSQASLMGQAGPISSGQAPAGASRAAPSPPSGGQFTHQTAGMPASQVSQALTSYFGTPFTPETSQRHADENPDYFPASSAQYFGHQEIIHALDKLQANTNFSQEGMAPFNGEALKKALLNEIAKSTGGAVTKSINNIAEKTIDFIEMIFDAIIDDHDISDAIKNLLLRLQIPIIKASMADQEFFIYDTHPARILLDKIAEVGVGVTDHNDEIYIKLDEIINSILTDYQLNEETFVKALARLEEYVSEQEAITRAREEEEQKEIIRKHARSTVLKSLRASTSGKVLPESVHALILKRWPTIMFNHFLQNGKDNSDWISMVLTLRQIIEFVQPIKTPEQLARIKQRKDILFEVTEGYLSESITSRRDIRQVMDAFIETVTNNIEDANFNDESVEQAEHNLPPDTSEQDVIEDEKQDLPEIPPNTVPGMWFQIYMGEDKIIRRCKLSVILIEDAKLLFVDHKGELVSEKTFDEFNAEVAQGKTEAIMGHSTFDHAFKAVIHKIH